jgi:hypothetical protein
MNLLRLAWKSLLNRRGTALLTMLTVAVSVALLLGVEKTRLHARQSFANTVSGTDLIVGARSGSVQLLLYSVFRIGNRSRSGIPTAVTAWSAPRAIISSISATPTSAGSSSPPARRSMIPTTPYSVPRSRDSWGTRAAIA